MSKTDQGLPTEFDVALIDLLKTVKSFFLESGKIGG